MAALVYFIFVWESDFLLHLALKYVDLVITASQKVWRVEA